MDFWGLVAGGGSALPGLLGQEGGTRGWGHTWGQAQHLEGGQGHKAESQFGDRWQCRDLFPVPEGQEGTGALHARSDGRACPPSALPWGRDRTGSWAGGLQWEKADGEPGQTGTNRDRPGQTPCAGRNERLGVTGARQRSKLRTTSWDSLYRGQEQLLPQQGRGSPGWSGINLPGFWGGSLRRGWDGSPRIGGIQQNGVGWSP